MRITQTTDAIDDCLKDAPNNLFTFKDYSFYINNGEYSNGASLETMAMTISLLIKTCSTKTTVLT